MLSGAQAETPPRCQTTCKHSSGHREARVARGSELRVLKCSTVCTVQWWRTAHPAPLLHS